MTAARETAPAPTLLEVLEQDGVWIDNEGTRHLVGLMTLRHKVNVLRWLEQRVEMIKFMADLQFACMIASPFGPRGDAAQDALDAAQMEMLETEPLDWLNEQPLVVRLRADVGDPVAEVFGDPDATRSPFDDPAVLERSPSGATASCRFCGTTYDLHGVSSDELPPIGDGCERCQGEAE